MQILPCPDPGHRLDTPTPDEISAALAALDAELVAPGVWMARLSNGATLRLTAPTRTDAGPAVAEVPDAE